MQFIIKGALRETGEDIELVVVADSELEAEQLANENGVLIAVRQTRLIEDTDDDLYDANLDDEPTSTQSEPEDATSVWNSASEADDLSP